MDFNTAIGIIKKDLEEARGLLEQMISQTDTHVAELEFARTRIKSAAELLEIFPQLKEVLDEPEKRKASHEPPVISKNPAPEKVIAPPPPAETIGQKIKETKEVTEKKTDKNDPVHTRPGETNKTILADKFAGPDRLGEKITTAKQDEIIVSVRSARPIDDIASAIGINDKFYFIRELFSGDSLAYQDTIKRLNSASSLGEAMKILDESTVMGSDPAAQSAFVDVVRRKFNINV